MADEFIRYLVALEYNILKFAEEDRKGRVVGGEYFGTHTRNERLLAMDGYDNSGVLEDLDERGIVKPLGHPFRFYVTEKGRLLMRIYELRLELIAEQGRSE
jgi:hypothetical protein